MLCSTVNSQFSFYISLYKINWIKIRTVSLVLSLSILAEILCVLFTWRHHSPATEKTFKLVELFFQSRKRNVFYNNWYWACSEILESRDFQSFKRGDTHLTSTSRGGEVGGKNETLSDVGRWEFSECSGRPILIFLLRKIRFAPWPDIVLTIFYWQKIFLLTLMSDSEAIL